VRAGSGPSARRSRRVVASAAVIVAAAAEDLDRPVDDLLRHVGRDDLDHRDLLPPRLVSTVSIKCAALNVSSAPTPMESSLRSQCRGIRFLYAGSSSRFCP
jgi:hypothetical protein